MLCLQRTVWGEYTEKHDIYVFETYVCVVCAMQSLKTDQHALPCMMCRALQYNFCPDSDLVMAEQARCHGCTRSGIATHGRL